MLAILRESRRAASRTASFNIGSIRRFRVADFFGLKNSSPPLLIRYNVTHMRYISSPVKNQIICEVTHVDALY